MRALIFTLFAVLATSVNADCGVPDVAARLTRAKWVDGCSTMKCPMLKGAGVLEQRCAEPVAVQLRITGYDKAGDPVATREMWPFNLRPVPTGSHPFSIDTWLDFDADIVKFSIEVVEVRDEGQ